MALKMMYTQRHRHTGTDIDTQTHTCVLTHVHKYMLTHVHRHVCMQHTHTDTHEEKSRSACPPSQKSNTVTQLEGEVAWLFWLESGISTSPIFASHSNCSSQRQSASNTAFSDHTPAPPGSLPDCCARLRIPKFWLHCLSQYTTGVCLSVCLLPLSLDFILPRVLWSDHTVITCL